MNSRLLALYGLKWHPFSSELPIEALYVPPRVEQFLWRIEQAQIREGGFAMVHGEPGSGKSVVLRLLAERLAQLPDLTVGAIDHPQSNLADFYRELGELLLFFTLIREAPPLWARTRPPVNRFFGERA